MTIPDKGICETLIDGAWTLMSVDEAHTAHRDADKRCPDCHGKVVTKGAYAPRRGAFMYHHRAHDGCPRIPIHYAGTLKPHPEALP